MYETMHQKTWASATLPPLILWTPLAGNFSHLKVKKLEKNNVSVAIFLWNMDYSLSTEINLNSKASTYRIHCSADGKRFFLLLCSSSMLAFFNEPFLLGSLWCYYVLMSPSARSFQWANTLDISHHAPGTYDNFLTSRQGRAKNHKV